MLYDSTNPFTLTVFDAAACGSEWLCVTELQKISYLCIEAESAYNINEPIEKTFCVHYGSIIIKIAFKVS